MVDQLCIWFPKGKWHKTGSLSILKIICINPRYRKIYIQRPGSNHLIVDLTSQFTKSWQKMEIYLQWSKWLGLYNIYLSRYKHLQMVCMLVFAKYISGLFDKWMMNALLDSFCVAIVLQKCHSWWCTNRDNISNLCK